MSNMSYCRFENTSKDLSDCIEALQYGEAPVSERECRAAERMFKEFLDYCVDGGIIDEYNEGAIGFTPREDDDE